MNQLSLKPVSVDTIRMPLYETKGIELDVLRLDKIDKNISGNKWFKLKEYVADALSKQQSTIVTFGGAWSNHILATAAFCKLNRLQSIGIIRGEKPAQLSTTLKAASEMGMQLFFTDRETYARKELPVELRSADFYLIPEGGYGKKGVEGAASILGFVDQNRYTHICCAAGTGTMAAGLIIGDGEGERERVAGKHPTAKKQEVLVFSVLKNNHSLSHEIDHLLKDFPGEVKNYSVRHNYHFGGYAKHPPALINFINEWYRDTGIPSDIIYTGKLFFGAMDLIKKDFFPSGSRILVIHSGGLQGNDSLSNGTLNF